MQKDWIGNSNSAWYSLASSNHSEEEREKNDYYATDPKALDIFLKKLEQDRITLHRDVWECACGEGHLSEELKKHGYNVWSTDLIDRGYGQGNVDFLKSISNEWHGDILTNPPYKYAKEFVEKALEVSRYIISFYNWYNF